MTDANPLYAEIDKLRALNKELYEALKAIHPYNTGYMESMDWRIYNEALKKVSKAIADSEAYKVGK